MNLNKIENVAIIGMVSFTAAITYFGSNGSLTFFLGVSAGVGMLAYILREEEDTMNKIES